MKLQLRIVRVSSQEPVLPVGNKMFVLKLNYVSEAHISSPVPTNLDYKAENVKYIQGMGMRQG